MTYPATLADVTAEWVTAVLAEAGVLDGARVVECHAEPLVAAPTFTGAFGRLQLTYDRRPHAAPETLVAKFSIDHPEVRAAVHSMGFYERETYFYRTLAPRIGVAVPRCYFGGVSPAGESLLLLEDLTSGRIGRTVDAMAAADAEHAVDVIAGLHASWWNQPDLGAQPILDPDQIMPVDTAATTFGECWPKFLAKLTTPVTDEVRQLGDVIAADLAASIDELFHTSPLTLIHHDYQADNMIFDLAGQEPMRVIDWQMPVRGRGVVDLAYLLSGSLAVRDRARTEAPLIARYAARLAADGVADYDTTRAYHDYRRALLIPPARLAIAVALSPQLTAHPGAFWEVIFDRQLRAAQDNRPDMAQR